MELGRKEEEEGGDVGLGRKRLKRNRKMWDWKVRKKRFKRKKIMWHWGGRTKKLRRFSLLHASLHWFNTRLLNESLVTNHQGIMPGINIH